MFKFCYNSPVFFIESQGSLGSSALPFCNNSMEILSGERINAMRPSRGGRKMDYQFQRTATLDRDFLNFITMYAEIINDNQLCLTATGDYGQAYLLFKKI